jgi:hypothetical protein
MGKRRKRDRDIAKKRHDETKDTSVEESRLNSEYLISWEKLGYGICAYLGFLYFGFIVLYNIWPH